MWLFFFNLRRKEPVERKSLNRQESERIMENEVNEKSGADGIQSTGQEMGLRWGQGHLS